MNVPSPRVGSAGAMLRASQRDMEMAQEVQAHLRPAPHLPLLTLAYAGLSLPASDLGGDCYDFLRPSSRRLVIAVGDVSGKGVGAALMMASLQAMWRMHYSMGGGDLASRLVSLNELFFGTTASGHFATLFLGEYDDRTRRLRYANCGHVPPLLLRFDGNLERLDPTAMLVGIRSEWTCTVDEVVLTPGDTLLICTDGATEARGRTGEQYGEARLAGALRRTRGLPLSALLEALVHDIRSFGGGALDDDLTLVVARSRRPEAPVRLGHGGSMMTAGSESGGSRATLHPSR